MDLTLVVLAAGLGSRYGGLKQMDKVGPGGETIIDYSIFDAIRSGVNKVVFVIRRDIETEFRNFFIPKLEGRVSIEFVHQELDHIPEDFHVPAERRKPWGTAHALMVAKEKISEAFIVINADDFYGWGSYRLLSEFLHDREDDKEGENKYAMVGFSLMKTLSKYGTVSRGICGTDGQGYLTEINEVTNIGYSGNTIVYEEGGRQKSLKPDVPVSMNIWGFQPSIFLFLEREFRAFLNDNLSNPKAEFYIPSVINTMIQQGEGKIKVLPGEEDWFGVTYQDDKPWVIQRIRSLVDAGQYPESLFL